MEVMQIAFADIEVSGRVRDLDEDKLARLQSSIEDVGQMSPIEVLAQDISGKPPYRLIAGLHRIEEVRRSGRIKVDAVVYCGAKDANTLRRREIDENLARAELSDYDRAAFLSERARLWIEQNGPIRPGRSKSGQVGRNSFVAETCEKFGISQREVRRHRERLEKVVPEVWVALKGTHVASNGLQLQKIAGLPADRQRALMELIGGSFGQPRKTFDVVFEAAYSSTRGLKPKTDLTAETRADDLARRYRDADPKVQRLFRRIVGLAVAKGKRAAPGEEV